MIPFTLEQVSELIRGRQSVYPKQFTGEAVDDETIHKILLNANSAPSHRNTEPWRFHVIAKSSAEAFITFQQSVYKREKVGEAYNDRKYKKLRSKVEQSSHIIIVGMERDKEESVPEWEEVAAVACAVQNIYLSLRPAGLGGYWSTPSLTINHIQEFIEMGERERCLGLFYIGIPQNELPPQVVKRPLDGKVRWV